MDPSSPSHNYGEFYRLSPPAVSSRHSEDGWARKQTTPLQYRSANTSGGTTTNRRSNMTTLCSPSLDEVTPSESRNPVKWVGGVPSPAEGMVLSSKSARGVTVTVSRIPTPEGCIPTIQVKYGKGGRGKICWWPDVERCRDQIAEVLEHFMNDCTSLGFPIRQAATGSKVAIATWNQARKATQAKIQT